MWSKIGLGVGLVGLLTLMAAEVAVVIVEPNATFVARSVRSFIIVGLALLVLCSFMWMGVARLLRGQRRLAELSDPKNSYAAGYADGLAGRPAAATLHLIHNSHDDGR